MDRLSIFPNAMTSVSIAESEVITTLQDELSDVKRELQLTRKGHEAWTWGEEVEDSEDIDLEDVE